MQNFGRMDKEHYGIFDTYWLIELNCRLTQKIHYIKTVVVIKLYCFHYPYNCKKSSTSCCMGRNIYLELVYQNNNDKCLSMCCLLCTA